MFASRLASPPATISTTPFAAVAVHVVREKSADRSPFALSASRSRTGPSEPPVNRRLPPGNDSRSGVRLLMVAASTAGSSAVNRRSNWLSRPRAAAESCVELSAAYIAPCIGSAFVP